MPTANLKPEKKYLGKLWITVIRCAGLRKVQTIGEQDPYVEIEVNGKKQKTKTMHDVEFNPEFGERFHWDLENVESPVVFFRVWNENKMVLDDVIGDLKVPLAVLLAKEDMVQKIPLYRSMKRQIKSGSMMIKVEYFGDGGLPKAPKASGMAFSRYGTFSLAADVAGVLEERVANNKLTFHKGQTLRDYFGFDACANAEKRLIVCYLGEDGKPNRPVVYEDVREDTVIELINWNERKAEAEAAKFEEMASLHEKEAERIREAHEKALEKAAEEAKARAVANEEKKKMASELRALQEALARTQASLKQVEAKSASLESKLKTLNEASNANAEVKAKLRNESHTVAGLKGYVSRLKRHKARYETLQKDNQKSEENLNGLKKAYVSTFATLRATKDNVEKLATEAMNLKRTRPTGAWSFGSTSTEKKNEKVTCKNGHLVRLYPRNGGGWACDGRHNKGGCKSGCTGFYQLRGVTRYRCSACDFDYCGKCHDFLANGEKEPESWKERKVTCTKGHELRPERYNTNGWACDGRKEECGCLSGCTGFRQLSTVERFRCRACDFDLCGKCYNSKKAGIVPVGKTCYLKAHTGKYVYTANRHASAQSSTKGTKEAVRFKEIAPGRYVITSVDSGKNLQVDKSQGLCRFENQNEGAWETFKIEKHGNLIFLMSHLKTVVQVKPNGTMYAENTNRQAWEGLVVEV
eukprot:CAMPEP_0167830274 /NCGR_PEP_ID=MMETSP0112_2-20121227/12821_1 /TAXON_ID=91324 /ORGANISM="Lotharella globosa, Strain CCCM811" /LENGTH=694 /DNA_ID=CAMNT_0007734455 /DNA_START=29 /DNA_END=2114 /DNA_ORIENTATION=-